MDDQLLIWGRPLNEYISTYQFEELKQRGLFNENPGSILTREADDALEALARIGDGSGPKKSGVLIVPIAMQKFHAILKLVQYPKVYSRLARPSAIGGCIKLMSLIKVNEKNTPFSYEYGYLCFRVLTIVLGICILDRSDRLDCSIEAMEVDARAHPQLDIMQLLGHYVSSSLFIELKGEGEERFDRIFGWVKVEGYPRPPPLVKIPDIEALGAMLWNNRKTFFKALRSTYYPGISSVVFVLWRVTRRERDSAKLKFQCTILNEIAFRHNLIVTSDQQHAMSYMNVDVGKGIHLRNWETNTQKVDLEDCREVIGAYIDRFNPLYPDLYGPITVLDGPIYLRGLAIYVVPGTEDLLPRVLEVTAKRIWDEIKHPLEKHKPDVYVDAIRDMFANYATILQNRLFSKMNSTFFQEMVDTIIESDLIDLAARGILMIELPSEPPAHHLAGSADYLPRVRNFYQQLSVSMPKNYIYAISDHCFSEWLKFRAYLTWCSEIRCLVPGDCNHIKECLGIWNYIGRALGYQVQEKSQFKCDYARCHDPSGMDGVPCACPICHNGTYCSPRCQSMDWKFGHSQGLHADSCIGAKALVNARPPV